jgi:hypothetical protein
MPKRYNKSHGASVPGTPPGSKIDRSMSNLASKAIRKASNSKKKPQYTDSGQNYKDANNKFISGSRVDEGELSAVKRKSPYRPYVKASSESMYSGEKLYLTKSKGAMSKKGAPTKRKKGQRELRSVTDRAKRK